ncbi:MAG: HAD family phosphatase [Muribaculaceae bacterium]|nr:HAD family phosphatase [Muribaculaceae bacterium]
MIKTIAFDMGGVIFNIDTSQAIRRFQEIGFDQASTYLDAYEQTGIFAQLESGLISAEDFRRELSRLCGKELTMDDCGRGWLGYYVSLPEQNLPCVQALRAEGFRTVLLSNTNPFMMDWARSERFDGHGHGIGTYFDALYLSYEMGVMKPSPKIFEQVIAAERLQPQEILFLDDSPHNIAAAAAIGMRTHLVVAGADWTREIESLLE